MKLRSSSQSRFAAFAAASTFLAAAIGFGAAVPSYSHLVHPLGLLGATGMPHALAFNLCGFVLPGLLLGWVALGFRNSLTDGISGAARIGAWLLLFSTLAFAAQGVFPLEIDDLDAGGSRRHVAAWTLWWLAFAAGAGCFAVGAWRVPGLRKLSVCVVLVAAAMLVLVLFTPAAWGGAVPQRLAFASWFGWWLFASWSLRSGRPGR